MKENEKTNKRYITAPIYNIEQANFYLEKGCNITSVGVKWDDDKGKTVVYMKFEFNEAYKKAKEIWMSGKRNK